MKYSKLNSIQLIAVGGAIAIGLPVLLTAQTTITWDGDTDSDFATGTNWVGDVAPANDLTTNIAELQGGTVTLDTGDRSVAGLDFDLGTTLSGANTFSVGASGINVSQNSVLSTGLLFNQNASIIVLGGRISLANTSSGAISGTGQLTFDGNNTVFIDGTDNTYSGGTIIGGLATASIKGINSLGTGAITLDGGKLSTNGNNITTGRGITLTATGGTMIANGGRWSVTQAITGAGSLTVENGNNTVFFDVANTFTEELIITGTGIVGAKGTSTLGDNSGGNNNIILEDGGTLSSNGSSVDTGTRTITLNGTGGTLTTNGARIGVGGIITGSGALTIGAGNNNVFLDNTGNDYTGGTFIEGLIRPKADGTLGAVSGAVTMNGGTFFPNQGNITYDSGRTFILDSVGGTFQANGTTTIDGVVEGAGDLTVAEGGTAFVLAGANTYTGNTILTGVGSNLRVTGSIGGVASSYAGVISGDGNVEFAGSGTQILTGNNTYTGTTTVSSGTLLIDGSHSGTGLMTVAAGSIIGGDGTIAGDLTIDAGGLFFFSASDTLTVDGTLSLDSTFGVASLFGLDSATVNGTYTLIAVSGDFSGIENFGIGNAFDLGSGKSAYFQNGSLQLVVVPEPSTYTLLFGLTVLGWMSLRRRRSA